MRQDYSILSAGATETFQLASAVAPALAVPSILSLNGPVGAGKTQFTRGLAHGLGVDAGASVMSPTFTLINEYPGKTSIFHFDVYRLNDDIAFLSLDPDTYFSANGISVIEWGERVASFLPEDRLEVTFDIVDLDRRCIRFHLKGERTMAPDLQKVLSSFSAEHHQGKKPSL